MRGYATAAALALIAGAATAAAAQEPAPAAAAPAAQTPGPEADPGAVRDPLEGFNRAMWKVNRGLDAAIIKPTSTVYRTITPRPARRGISHLFANLTEPWSFINALLQGNSKRAFNSLGRFLINTTIGVGGLADHATKMGLKPTPEDFGQTLAHWGVKSSAYLVLPVLGPSTVRDGIGTGVAFFADPYRIGLKESGLTRTQRYGVNALEVISTRSDLTDAGADSFLDSSLDPYAAARSAYLQRRQAAILDQDDAAPAGGASGAAGDDASLDAAVAEIKAEQAAQGGAATPDAAPPPAPEAQTPAAPPEATPPPASPQ